MSSNCLSAAPGKLHRSWHGGSGSGWGPTSNFIHTTHYLLGCVDAQPPHVEAPGGSQAVQFLGNPPESKSFYCLPLSWLMELHLE